MKDEKTVKTGSRIPKIIHYCWFGGGEMSEIMVRCLESWKKVLPDYEIREWNEKNFDVGMLIYTRQAFDKRKFAFVSDFVRLWAIQKYGGIFLDTDVEVLKPLDVFLEKECFFGFENDFGVNPGLIMGAVPDHPLFPELMDFYINNPFLLGDSINTRTSVMNCTEVLMKHGLVADSSLRQDLGNAVVYEKNVFCPDKEARESGVYSPETYTAHHYAGTWRHPKYNERLKNPIWHALVNFSAFSGKCAAKILGQSRWDHIKTHQLRGLYDIMRGVKSW